MFAPERSIPQRHCPDFILQAQLIALLPQNCLGHGKPDKSMWFDVTADENGVN